MIKMLASDLDGTLIPLEKTPTSWNDIQLFKDAIENTPDLYLAYVTGRDFTLALDGLKEYDLPDPDFLICDVGTSVYTKEDKEWKQDDAYSLTLLQLWNNLDSYSLPSELDKIKGLELQEAKKQNRFKRSYYYEPDREENIDQEIKNILSKNGIKAKLIYSFDEKKKTGLLDILPPDTAKHTGLSFICSKLSLDMNEIVYAGDSGNDLAIIYNNYKSILVGNTPDDVKEKAIEYSKSGENLYIADSDSAAGVLEGCNYFNVFVDNE